MTPENTSAYLTADQRTLLRRFMNHVGAEEEAAMTAALTEIDRLNSEIDRLRDQVAALRKVVTGEVNHLYRGLCPDVRLGENVGGVDPDCPACATLEVQP